MSKLKNVQVFALLLAATALFISGCLSSPINAVQNNLDFEPGSVTYYLDEYVRRMEPKVHVHPVTDASGLKVLFVPFRVTQRMDSPELIGHAVSKTFWQTFAGKHIFNYMEFMADAGPFRRDVAVRKARARGADMVIGGFVTHYMHGGNKLDSSMAVTIEAYDVSSGLLVWSIAHAGVMPAQQTKDFILFATKTRIPADTMYAINEALSMDIADIMGKWSQAEENDPEAEKPEFIPAYQNDMTEQDDEKLK